MLPMTNIPAIKNLTLKQWKIFLMIFPTLLIKEYFIFHFTQSKGRKTKKVTYALSIQAEKFFSVRSSCH